MGEWTTDSPLHVGGEPVEYASNADMVVLKAHDDSYFIPGASLAGVARNWLARTSTTLDVYRTGRRYQPDAVKYLFGGEFASKDPKFPSEFSSALTVLDAPQVGSKSTVVDVRDGVRIDSKTGTATDKAKYDFEVLPSGTSFRLVFLLSTYDTLPGKLQESDIRAEFLEMLAGFGSGEIKVGARTKRGFGTGKLTGDWKVRRLDMTVRDHVEAWLERDWKRQNAPDRGEPVQASKTTSRTVRRLKITAELALKTSLLIKSAGKHPASPDSVHLMDGLAPVLSGTSLAGALRHRCERIAKTMQVSEPDALINSMFGPTIDPQRKTTAQLSRVNANESKLSGGELHVQNRVSIDRFTGGALDGRLFNSAPYWPKSEGPHVTIVLELELEKFDDSESSRPSVNGIIEDTRETSLLLQAFKDLWLGDMPLGGEVGGGRGIFYGVSAEIEHPSLGSCVRMVSSDTNNPALVPAVTGDIEGLDRISSNLGVPHEQ